MHPAVERFGTPADFLNNLQPYLEEKEAANHQLLGAAIGLAQALPPAGFYAAATGESDEWTGAALLVGARLHVYGQTATAMRALAADLATTTHRPRAVTAPGTAAHVLADAFAAATGQGYFVGLQERCYQLTQTREVAAPPGEMRAAREGEASVLGEWLAALQAEAFGRQITAAQGAAAVRRLLATGALFVWEVDRPVSMVATGLPTRRGTPLAQLFTRASLRNRGYGTALITAVGRLLFAEGRQFTTALIDISAAVPTYVFLKAGYKTVTDLYTYHFGPAS